MNQQVTKSSSALDDNKREVQKQWDADPCGANTVKEGIDDDSLHFYRAARAHRYEIYGPWFDSMMRFDEVHDREVLEIGVGLGSDHFRFARNGNTMTALDLSREHLRHTQQHLSLEGLSTEAVYGDAESLPFNDATFDVVYTFGVLHHTTHIDKALSEILRVLRPGGTAVVGLYHRHSYYFWIQKMLAEGVLKFGLLRKGYRRLMSEIEFRREPNSAVPLVRVFSRTQVKTLFSHFGAVDLRTCHVEPGHFYRLSPLLRGLSRERLERWFGGGGWYVIVRAVK